MRYFRRFIQLFTNKKIRTKLLGIYLIITVIPILLVGLYLNHNMRNVVLNNVIEDLDANIDKMDMRLNTALNRAIDISDLIYINQDLKKLIEKEYKSDLEIFNAYQKYPIFDEYLKYYDEIKDIRLFITKEMITDSHIVYADEKIQREPWYQQAIEKRGQISWEYIQDHWTGERYLSLTRAVFGENNEILGVLNIYISPNYLSKIFEKELHNVYISLDSEQIVHSNNPHLIGRNSFFVKHQVSAIENQSCIFDDTLNGEDVKVYLRSFKPQKTLSNSIQITAIIPIQEVIKDSDKVLLKGYLIVSVSLIASVSLLTLFISSFNKRIYILRNAMDNVAKGNLQIKELNLGKDEIGQVYKDLGLTVESIKQLINEVYIHKINKEQLKRRQKESEFKLLASQINPHFLYNTLEMIRMKAIINEDYEVSHIIRLLSKIMRSSLEITDRPIPLSSELDLVKSYLEIQKLRFEDQLEFDIDIRCDVKQYKILPLLLQPIVENSVKHGVENEIDQCYIHILIYESDKYLIIKVFDNGIGIPEAKLTEMQSRMDQIDTKSDIGGIGLYNVHQRIKLFYGEEYGLKLKSKVGVGTTAILLLPLLKGADEHV